MGATYPNVANASRSFIVGNGLVNDGVVIMGDSIPTYNFGPITIASITDNGDGTATITYDGTNSLQSYVGDLIQVEGHATTKLNVINAPVTAQTISGTKVTALTYTYSGYTYNSLASAGTLYIRLKRRLSDQGAIGIAQFLSGARFRILDTFAIGGFDSEQMEAQLDAAIALMPKAICVQVGTNNVYARAWAPSRSIASIKRAADKIARAGIVPVFGLILPRVDGSQNSTTAANLAPVNSWMRDYLPSVGGYCVDHWGRTANGTTFADQASTIGAANSGFLGDGIHPNRQGAWAMGKAWSDVLSQIFPAKNRLRPNLTEATAANGKLFFNNPGLTGTSGTTTAGSGTITGTAPTGTSLTIVSGTPTVTTSQIARTEAADGDAVGNWFRMVITGAGAGTNVLLRIAVTPSNWSFGDLVQGGMRIRVTSGSSPGSGAPTNMTTPELLVNVTTATSGTDVSYGTYNQTTGTSIDEAYSGIALTPTYAFKASGTGVHGALSYIRLDLNIYFRTGSGNATVDIAHPFLGVPVN